MLRRRVAADGRGSIPGGAEVAADAEGLALAVSMPSGNGRWLAPSSAAGGGGGVSRVVHETRRSARDTRNMAGIETSEISRSRRISRAATNGQLAKRR
jgi:hypothetical protein